jgi:hypothetical protein
MATPNIPPISPPPVVITDRLIHELIKWQKIGVALTALIALLFIIALVFGPFTFDQPLPTTTPGTSG